MASEKRGARSEAIRNFVAANPEAGPKAVVEGLKMQGVEVSANLVSSIKYGKKAVRSSKQGARRGRARLSASEQIRRMLAKNPGSGPKEIREKLAKKGINVSSGLVSFVKFNFKNSSTLRAPVVQSAARKTALPQIGFEQLVEVKKVADMVGGAEQLRHALDMLAQLA
jgi:hypothetical protein